MVPMGNMEWAEEAYIEEAIPVKDMICDSCVAHSAAVESEVNIMMNNVAEKTSPYHYTNDNINITIWFFNSLGIRGICCRHGALES